MSGHHFRHFDFYSISGEVTILAPTDNAITLTSSSDQLTIDVVKFFVIKGEKIMKKDIKKYTKKDTMNEKSVRFYIHERKEKKVKYLYVNILKSTRFEKSDQQQGREFN